MATTKMDAMGRRLLDALEEYIHTECNEDPGSYGKPPSAWKRWPLLYSAYCSDREGCVRESGVFGDVTRLESEIIDMFGTYYRAIRDFLLEDLSKNIQECWIDVVVEPSYEDRSKVIVTYKNTVLCGTDAKAWHFCWDNPQDMAEEMLDDYKTMKEHLQKALAGGELRKAYVIVPIYKGLLQSYEVKVTFCQDKALKLRAAADERLGIVRDEDDHYDSESDVHMEVVDIVW